MHHNSVDPNMDADIFSAIDLDLVAIHNELVSHVETKLASLPGESTGIVLAYLHGRSQQLTTIKQDLLPLLAYIGVKGRFYQDAVPLAASWALYLAAAHLLDDAQDNGNMPSANGAVAALGAANIALANLSCAKAPVSDILDALGRVTVIGVNAQAVEKKDGRPPSRTEYFQSIAGKAAVIIATGAWIGGRLATDDPDKLSSLKEFGLAWGMATQITDDCLDLAEDLANGLVTLPIIEGMANTGHPQHSLLVQLVGKNTLEDREIQTVLTILEDMGAFATCRRLVRAYQIQATAVLTTLPGLKPFFETHAESTI